MNPRQGELRARMAVQRSVAKATKVLSLIRAEALDTMEIILAAHLPSETIASVRAEIERNLSSLDDATLRDLTGL